MRTVLIALAIGCGGGGHAAIDGGGGSGIDGHLHDTPPPAATRYLKEAFADPSDKFGTAIAMSADGKTLAVGAIEESSAATGINGDASNEDAASAGAVFVFARDPGDEVWMQQAYVKADNTAIGALFGTGVALSADGNVLVVGAPHEGGTGAVYAFARTGTTWAQTGAALHATIATADDQLGAAVAVSGDGLTIAAAAPGASAAYVFVGGTQRAKLSAEGTTSVALDGTGATLVAGTPIATGARGQVLAFARTTLAGDLWSTPDTLVADNADPDDGFGGSVAIAADGATIVVGAAGEDGAGNATADCGAAYVYVHGTAWTQEAHLAAANADPGDAFGTSVAIASDGTAIVVGAIDEGGMGTDRSGDPTSNAYQQAGAAYLFARSGATWAAAANGYLKATNTDPNDHFGASVSIDGTGAHVGVGAPGEASKTGEPDNNSAAMAGAAYLYF